MTTVESKICNFNCSCVRDDCTYKHYIESPEDRVHFKELYDTVIDKKFFNETDPEGIRKRVCAYGMLCANEDCGFKHFCSYNGRMLMRREWFKSINKKKNSNILDELNERYNFSEEDYDRLRRVLERK